ncbi:MAG: hypothetical protein DRH93_13905 [Deltaproteobacteria bacterium]|nr:MAG: hypothetical protein DRH93_13905 [Deltaproteobacteria bacterium]
MRIGFIGTGVITSAIVTGLCTSNFPVEAIWISPRNREKSKNLEQKFDPVNIGDSNQEVLENSDVVVLGILPGHKNKILEPLEFQSSQVIVHLLAGVSTGGTSAGSACKKCSKSASVALCSNSCRAGSHVSRK